MVVAKHCDAWVLISDHYRATLLGCSALKPGRCRLTDYATIESPIPDIAFCDPYPARHLSPHSYASNARRLDDEYRRYARRLARWIDQCIERFEIERLIADVPERLHEELIDHLPYDRRPRVELSSENMAGLTRDVLAKHPAILGVLEAAHAQHPGTRDSAIC